MKILVYRFLALGLAILGISVGFSKLNHPSSNEIQADSGIVYNLNVNKTYFTFQVADSENMYSINSDMSTYSDVILKQLRNIQENDSIKLLAYHDYWGDSDILTIINLKINDSLIFNESTFHKAQTEASYYAFGVGILMLICFCFIVFINFYGNNIIETAKAKMITTLSAKFNSIKTFNQYIIIQHSNHTFIAYHDYIAEVQKYGNRNNLLWLLWNRKELPNDVSTIIKNGKTHNLSFGLRPNALKKKFEKEINNYNQTNKQSY